MHRVVARKLTRKRPDEIGLLVIGIAEGNVRATLLSS
jgi:hypothetical protein